MLSLTKGNYLDTVQQRLEDRDIIVSSSLYFGNPSQDIMHYHENTHLSFVISGGYRERRKNTDKEIHPGGITFYYAGEYHQSNGTKQCSKNINLEIASSFFTEAAISESEAAHTALHTPGAKNLLVSMYKELSNADPLASSSVRMLLYNLFKPFTDSPTRKAPTWAGLIRDCLQDRWNEWVTLEELSALADKHPVTVSRQCFAYFGCSLGEYSRKLKIERSLELISSSSLIDIAHRCGFADQSHFTRHFKRLTGFLPGEYQKLSIGQNI